MTDVLGKTLPVEGSETYRDIWAQTLEEALVQLGLYAGAQHVTFSFPTTEAMVTGDGQAKVIIPAIMNGLDLTSISAIVATAGTTGTCDIQIHNETDGVDMLSTVLTIDSGETSSATAATPAVIDTSNDDIATNDVLRLDVDAVHTTEALGLVVVLEFRYP